jgi:hypothetical protein
MESFGIKRRWSRAYRKPSWKCVEFSDPKVVVYSNGVAAVLRVIQRSVFCFTAFLGMEWRVLVFRRSPSAKYHPSIVYWIEVSHYNVTGLGKEGMEAFVDSLSEPEKEQLWTKKSG